MENQRERELKKPAFTVPHVVILLTTGSPLAGLGMHAERKKPDPIDRMCCTSLKKSQHLKCVNVGNSTRPDVMYFAGDTCINYAGLCAAALRCCGMRRGLPARRQAQAQRKVTTLR